MLKKCVKVLTKNLIKIMNKLFGIDENKVVFTSFRNKYACNPKAISEKLHEMYPDVKIVWLFSNLKQISKDIPDYIIKAKYNSLRGLKEIATSKVWVNNNLFGEAIYKSDKQFYIETWHGDRSVKKILIDVSKNVDRFSKYPKIDLCVAGSDFMENVFHTAFNYYGNILKVGTPRDDILLNLNQTTINKIKAKLKLPLDCKVLIFAPTFRDSKITEKQSLNSLNITETLNNLQKKYDCKWICLMRTHPILNNGFEKNILDERCMDVSNYDDMADLLAISDILITDYSSCMGDFILTGKPVILYHSDVEYYAQNDREFYFDLKESPFSIAYNQQELNKLIEGLDELEIKENCRKIYDFFKTHETGKASEEVVKIIISKLKEG